MRCQRGRILERNQSRHVVCALVICRANTSSNTSSFNSTSISGLLEYHWRASVFIVTTIVGGQIALFISLFGILMASDFSPFLLAVVTSFSSPTRADISSNYRNGIISLGPRGFFSPFAPSFHSVGWRGIAETN